jgi:phage/plasmid-associated DNA primase
MSPQIHNAGFSDYRGSGITPEQRAKWEAEDAAEAASDDADDSAAPDPWSTPTGAEWVSPKLIERQRQEAEAEADATRRQAGEPDEAGEDPRSLAARVPR